MISKKTPNVLSEKIFFFGKTLGGLHLHHEKNNKSNAQIARAARGKTLIYQAIFHIKMDKNEIKPVDNSSTSPEKKRGTLDQNELRAMAGGVALIIIILLIVKNDGTGNYNNIIFILIGFFVGGSLLTSRNMGE